MATASAWQPALYQRAGVKEYFTVDALHRRVHRRVVGRRLVGSSCRAMAPDGRA